MVFIFSILKMSFFGFKHCHFGIVNVFTVIDRHHNTFAAIPSGVCTQSVPKVLTFVSENVDFCKDRDLNLGVG